MHRDQHLINMHNILLFNRKHINSEFGNINILVNFLVHARFCYVLFTQRKPRLEAELSGVLLLREAHL